MTNPLANCSPSEVERLIHHMPSVALQAQSDFVRGFAQSIAKQSRRKGWWPSQKQLPVMRGLVSDLFTYGSEQGGDIQLFE